MTKGTAMAQLVSLDKYRSSRRADAQSLGLKTAGGSKRRADICFDRSEFSVLMKSLQPTSRSGSLKRLYLDTPARHRCFFHFSTRRGITTLYCLQAGTPKWTRATVRGVSRSKTPESRR